MMSENYPGLPRALRWICKHDSFTVEGCETCAAADAIERLSARVSLLEDAIMKACGDDEDMVNAYIQSVT